MTVKSQIEIDLKNNPEFQAFVEKVDKLNDMLAEMPKQWKALGESISKAVGSEASKSVGTFEQKLEGLKNQLVSMQATTIGFSNSFRNAEVSAGNIFAAMRGTAGLLLGIGKQVLGGAMGLGQSIWGWSMYGLNQMLGIGREQMGFRNQALAQGGTPGFSQAQQRIWRDTPLSGLFGGIAEAEQGMNPMWGRLGVNQSRNLETDTYAVLRAARPKLMEWFKQGTLGMNFGRLNIPGMDFASAMWLGNPNNNLEDFIKRSQAVSGGAPGFDATRAMQNTVLAFEAAVAQMRSKLANALLPLYGENGPLTKVVQGFTKLAVQFIGSKSVQDVISQFASGLSHFADWLAGPEGQKKLAWVIDELGKGFHALFNEIEHLPEQFHALHEWLDAIDNSPIVKWLNTHFGGSIGGGVGMGYDFGRNGPLRNPLDIQGIMHSGTAANIIARGRTMADILANAPNADMAAIAGLVAFSESSLGTNFSAASPESNGPFQMTSGYRRYHNIGSNIGASGFYKSFDELRAKYGDWQKALAAYVIGEGDVDRAISSGDWKAGLQRSPLFSHIAGNAGYATAILGPSAGIGALMSKMPSINIVLPGIPGGQPIVSSGGAAAALDWGIDLNRGW